MRRCAAFTIRCLRYSFGPTWEIFEFEGVVYKSALLPAPFSRVRRQLEAVSPYVDKILVYQTLGMTNAPGSPAFAGHEDSTALYADYARWLRDRYPDRTELRLGDYMSFGITK